MLIGANKNIIYIQKRGKYHHTLHDFYNCLQKNFKKNLQQNNTYISYQS